MDTFVRNNRVLPPVLALLALFVVAWILAGTYIDATGQEPVAHRADLAQSKDAPGPQPSPEIENRDVDSYAAYRSKDPFRQLFAPAEATSEQTNPETTEQTTPEDTNGTGRAPGATPGNGGSQAKDTDNDGLTDRREQALGLDPRNPDTDNDGTPDGADDADGDGRPDGGARNGAGGGKPGAGSGGGRGGRPGRGDDLLDSGGILSPP